MNSKEEAAAAKGQGRATVEPNWFFALMLINYARCVIREAYVREFTIMYRFICAYIIFIVPLLSFFVVVSL